MKNNGRLIILLAIVRFIIPYLLQNSVYEPHRDEFLYLAEGQHLAWGYLEVPPLLSVFAWLAHLFGNSVFWIKFWPNLFGSLTFIICAKAIDKLGGGKFAIWLLFFVFVFGAWLRMFFLFQPNAPEIFFSALLAYGIFRYQQTMLNKYLYLFGVAVGFGLLTKYTTAFWAVSICAGLLFTKARSIFSNKHFYFSLAIALLIFLPNLLWQLSHRFPVFNHMRELKETQLQYVSPFDFLKEELLMYLPVFFIWIAGIYFCFTAKGKPFRLFGIAFLLLQVLMLVLHGKAYYTAGSFTIMFAFGALHIERIVTRSRSVVKYAVVAFPLITGIIFWPVLLPVFSPEKLSGFYKSLHIDKSGALNWEDGKSHELPQDFADMLGWKEMALKTAKAYQTLSAVEKKNAIIWCDNYGQAGAVSFYHRQLNIPQAYSANGSFLFWFDFHQFPENVVLISENQEPLEDPGVKQFADATIIDSIVNPFAREKGATILVLKQPSEKFRQFFEQRMDSLRHRFGALK